MDKKKSFLFLERKHQKRSKDQGDTHLKSVFPPESWCTRKKRNHKFRGNPERDVTSCVIVLRGLINHIFHVWATHTRQTCEWRRDREINHFLFDCVLMGLSNMKQNTASGSIHPIFLYYFKSCFSWNDLWLPLTARLPSKSRIQYTQ